MFDFVPKIICMLGQMSGGLNGSLYIPYFGQNTSSYQGTVMFCDILTSSYISSAGFYYGNTTTQGKKSADGKTIYWYSNNSASEQLNSYSDYGNTYYYLAIG